MAKTSLSKLDVDALLKLRGGRGQAIVVSQSRVGRAAFPRLGMLQAGPAEKVGRRGYQSDEGPERCRSSTETNQEITGRAGALSPGG